jgi:hypothetical protein
MNPIGQGLMDWAAPGDQQQPIPLSVIEVTDQLDTDYPCRSPTLSADLANNTTFRPTQ